MRARECRLYLALSIIAPSVNVLGRTRPKPSTLRGSAPDVVIGQSTAAPAGARPRGRQGLEPSLTRGRGAGGKGWSLRLRAEGERVPERVPTTAVGRDLHGFLMLTAWATAGLAPSDSDMGADLAAARQNTSYF